MEIIKGDDQILNLDEKGQQLSYRSVPVIEYFVTP
jgi:hypothetical protein